MVVRVLIAAGLAGGVAFPALALAVGPFAPFVLVPWALAVSFFAAGAFALRRAPRHRFAVRLMAIGSLHLLAFGVSPLAEWLSPRPAAVVVSVISSISFGSGFVAWLAALAVYPDGRYERRVERLLVRVAGLLMPVLSAGAVLGDRRLLVALPLGRQSPPNPAHLAALVPVAVLVPLLANACLLLGIALLVFRYRRAVGIRRMAMRWPVVSGIVLAAAVASAPLSSRILPPEAVALGFVAAAMSLPVTLVLGLVRHGAFDVNLAIRRTVVYSAMWLGITGLYAAVAGVLGVAAGQRAPLSVAVLTTVAAALLFQPARRQMERLADRWLFGRRLSGYEIVRALGTTFERSHDLADVFPKLLAALRAGLGAEWTRGSTREGPLAADGVAPDSDAGAALVVPIVHEGTVVGTIEAGPRRQRAYDEADEDLARTVAQQASLAISNASLAADLAGRLRELDEQARELTASRARIVQAQQSERRRIERNIHDGVQQQVVALMAKLELARTVIDADPLAASTALVEAQRSVRHTLADLRDLASGIYPSVLVDQGLVEAVEARASHTPLAVTIEAAPRLRETRLAPDVEAAAYFVVAEALTNAMKHGGAERARIAIDLGDAWLQVEVVDDGKGFDTATALERGLEGLRDRVEALGGSFTVRSEPGLGTTVRARLACAEAGRG